MTNPIHTAADALVTTASLALAEHARIARGEERARSIAVQAIASSAVRAATARLAMDRDGGGFTDADELGMAHRLIAELAMRLAERQVTERPTGFLDGSMTA